MPKLTLKRTNQKHGDYDVFQAKYDVGTELVYHNTDIGSWYYFMSYDELPEEERNIPVDVYYRDSLFNEALEKLERSEGDKTSNDGDNEELFDIRLDRAGYTNRGNERYLASYNGGAELVYKSPARETWLYAEDSDVANVNRNIPLRVYNSDASFELALKNLEARENSKTSDDRFDDTNKHTNEAGGTQTYLPMRADLIPSDALLDVAEVLAAGAEKYGANNWKLISNEDHVNHALVHIYRYQMGDTSEHHLAHALCRLLFATHIDNNPQDKSND